MSGLATRTGPDRTPVGELILRNPGLRCAGRAKGGAGSGDRGQAAAQQAPCGVEPEAVLERGGVGEQGGELLLEFV